MFRASNCLPSLARLVLCPDPAKDPIAESVTTANIMPGSGNVIGDQTLYVKLRGQTVEQMTVEAGDGVLGGRQVIPERSRPMPTVRLVDENDPDPIVQQVFADIKATKKIDFIPAIWRALATNPPHLELCWTRLKAIMKPGNKIDLLTKEIIALAVSVTNGCRYCINSHTTAVQKLGLDAEGYAEVLAVIGLYGQMNQAGGRLPDRARHRSATVFAGNSG